LRAPARCPLINLRASLAFANEWQVSVYARNVTDEEAEYGAIASVQGPLAAVGARPRTITDSKERLLAAKSLLRRANKKGEPAGSPF